MERVKPNFLIVGAAKAGTTSLYHYLKQHPQIFLAAIKEPQFFVAEKVQNSLPQAIRSEDAYFDLFCGSGAFPMRGEASVFYLYYWEDAIPRIKHYLGDDTRIIIILRNPVERTYSAYCHVYRHNPVESLDFPNALRTEEVRKQDTTISPMTHYKSMGLYSNMVSAFRKNFKNVCIVFFDDLTLRPHFLLGEIQRFLGVEVLNLNSSERYNAGGTVWKSNIKKQVIKASLLRNLKMAARKNFSGIYCPLKEYVYNHWMKQPDSMDEDIRKELLEFYRADIIALSHDLEIDLSHWLK